MSFLSILASMLNPNLKENTLMPILSYAAYRSALHPTSSKSTPTHLPLYHASAYYSGPASLSGQKLNFLGEAMTILYLSYRHGGNEVKRSRSWWGQALPCKAPASDELFARCSCSPGGKNSSAGLKCSGKSGDSISEALSHEYASPRSKGSIPSLSCHWLSEKNCTFFYTSVILVINAMVFGFVFCTQMFIRTLSGTY